MYVFDVTPASARARRHRRNEILKRIGRAVLALAVAATVVAVLGLVIGPHVLGYRTAVMAGGGMEGSIDSGDVVVSVPKPVSDVRYGDIVTFEAPVADHHLVTHRVIGVQHLQDGRTAIATRGDGNPMADPWHTTLRGDTVWETRYVVPKVGHVVNLAHTAVLRYGAVWIAFAGILALGVSLVRRREPSQATERASQRPRLTLIGSGSQR